MFRKQHPSSPGILQQHTHPAPTWRMAWSSGSAQSGSALHSPGAQAVALL